MEQHLARDLEYSHAGTRMIGRLFDPVGEATGAGVLVVHGAHGLDEHVTDRAAHMAELGHTVLAVDLWGDRRLISRPEEIGPTLARFVGDRGMWMGRIEAARRALVAATGVSKLGLAGYCFGGSSALEFLRTGGDAEAVVSFHGGLDVVGDDWSGAMPGAQVLICTGAADPMAPSADLARVEAGLSGAAIAWETNVYGQAKHAFTEFDRPGTPPFAAYDARADRRSWSSTRDFFNHALAAQED